MRYRLFNLKAWDDLLEFLTQTLNGLPRLIVVRSIIEVLRHKLATVTLQILLRRVVIGHRGENRILLADIDGVQCIGLGDHLLMQFLSRTDTHLYLFQIRSDGCSHIRDTV